MWGFTGDVDVRIVSVRRTPLKYQTALCTKPKSCARPVIQVKDEDADSGHESSGGTKLGGSGGIFEKEIQPARDEKESQASRSSASEDSTGSDEEKKSQPAWRRFQVRLDVQGCAEVTRVPIHSQDEWNALTPQTRFQCAQKRVAYWTEELSRAAKELRHR